jgi:polygalacturonase
VTVACSPSWNVHPYFSDNIDVIDVAVEAPKNSPNTDAIDPEACDRVDIIGCRLSVGDDCIAIKSGKIELARIFKRPASRHTVRNCLMEFGHGALTLGSELGGGVRDLVVERCVFSKTDRGLRIKTRRGRGKHSIVDGVLFENIKMDGVLTPIVINSFYHCDPDGRDEYVQTREPLPIDDRTPYLGKFTFKSISCTDCEIAACYCEGLPERPIDSITLENVDFSFSEDARTDFPAMCDNVERYSCAGMIFRQVRSLTLKNVSLNGIRGERLITSAVGSIEEK